MKRENYVEVRSLEELALHSSRWWPWHEGWGVVVSQLISDHCASGAHKVGENTRSCKLAMFTI